MVAGLERYYQIARCFRDEDLRADRQPEFTQLDLEMSFVEEKDILDLMEELFTALVEAVTPEFTVTRPVPRMTYAQAMDRYGTDKPDLRFGLELAEISDLAAETELGVFRTAIEQGGTVKGFAAPGCGEYTRKQLDELTEIAKERGAKGLVTIALGAVAGLEAIQDGDVRSAVAKFLTLDQVKEIARRLGWPPRRPAADCGRGAGYRQRGPRPSPPGAGAPPGARRPQHLRLCLYRRFPAAGVEAGRGALGLAASPLYLSQR